MNQQLTLANDLVNYLSDSLPTFRENDAIKAVELIDQNFIVSDANVKHFNCIIDSIDNIQDQLKKNEIQKLFTYWIQEKKYLVDCEYQEDRAGELDLALNSEDKIYFNPNIDNKTVKKYLKKIGDVESHNIQSFLNPEPYHRLKHLPSLISLEMGVYYDLFKLFNPFLRDSKNIRIEDPYLPNNTASYNVLKIIENLRHQNITLVFLTRSKYAEHPVNDKRNKKESVYDKFIEKLKALNNDGYQINFSNHFRKKIHRERYLFTEEIQIRFPGGLDFLGNDGYLRNDTNSDISEKKEIRIEELNFEIEF